MDKNGKVSQERTYSNFKKDSKGNIISRDADVTYYNSNESVERKTYNTQKLDSNGNVTHSEVYNDSSRQNLEATYDYTYKDGILQQTVAQYKDGNEIAPNSTKKITTYDNMGNISKEVITQKDGTTITRTYKNGELTGTETKNPNTNNNTSTNNNTNTNNNINQVIKSLDELDTIEGVLTVFRARDGHITAIDCNSQEAFATLEAIDHSTSMANSKIKISLQNDNGNAKFWEYDAYGTLIDLNHEALEPENHDPKITEAFKDLASPKINGSEPWYSGITLTGGATDVNRGGKTSHAEYDSTNRLAQVTTSGFGKTSKINYSYFQNTSIVSKETYLDEDGNTITTFYNLDGTPKQITVQDKNGNYTSKTGYEYEMDENGIPKVNVYVNGELNSWQTALTDTEGNIANKDWISTQVAQSNKTNHEHSKTDGRKQFSYKVYDSVSYIETVTENGSSTSYLVKVDKNGNEIERAPYSANNTVTREETNNGKVSRYNKDNQILYYKDDSVERAYEYDENGTLRQITENSNNANKTTFYDETGTVTIIETKKTDNYGNLLSREVRNFDNGKLNSVSTYNSKDELERNVIYKSITSGNGQIVSDVIVYDKDTDFAVGRPGKVVAAMGSGRTISETIYTDSSKTQVAEEKLYYSDGSYIYDKYSQYVTDVNGNIVRHLNRTQFDKNGIQTGSSQSHKQVLQNGWVVSDEYSVANTQYKFEYENGKVKSKTVTVNNSTYKEVKVYDENDQLKTSFKTDSKGNYEFPSDELKAVHDAFINDSDGMRVPVKPHFENFGVTRTGVPNSSGVSSNGAKYFYDDYGRIARMETSDSVYTYDYYGNTSLVKSETEVTNDNRCKIYNSWNPDGTIADNLQYAPANNKEASFENHYTYEYKDGFAIRHTNNSGTKTTNAIAVEKSHPKEITEAFAFVNDRDATCPIFMRGVSYLSNLQSKGQPNTTVDIVYNGVKYGTATYDNLGRICSMNYGINSKDTYTFTYWGDTDIVKTDVCSGIYGKIVSEYNSDGTISRNQQYTPDNLSNSYIEMKFEYYLDENGRPARKMTNNFGVISVTQG